MSVFITGDTHGGLDIDKLTSQYFDGRDLTKDDYVIIVGDFGFIWGGRNEDYHEYWLDWFESRPWTTLFIDGNHENHDELNSFPETFWHGGYVHEIRPGVLHLMRGYIFDIGGYSMLAMGGARSIDRDMRVSGVSWWESEKPDDEERTRCYENLEAAGNRVDVVLTHEGPASMVMTLAMRCNRDWTPDEYSVWLDNNVDRVVNYDKWFFGHYHEDCKSLGIGGRGTCLYDNIYDLDADDWSDRQLFPQYTCVDDLPESKNPRGYAVSEIAELLGADIDDVNAAIGYAMYGSACALSDDGEILIYRCDMHRILPLI